ncbi:MAG: DUF4118 domain-containing protein, partial [Acidobacteriota bacterium]
MATPTEPLAADETAAEAEEVKSAPRSVPASAREYAVAVAIVGFATLIALALRPYLAATNLAMMYLLGVVVIATRCSRSATVIASFLSVAAFDFFCVLPYYTFRVAESEYLITFAAMLAVALVISAQTSRIRAQIVSAVDRESRTQALYRLSRRLSPKTCVFDAALAAA